VFLLTNTRTDRVESATPLYLYSSGLQGDNIIMSDADGLATEAGHSNASPIELSDNEKPTVCRSEQKNGQSSDSQVDMTELVKKGFRALVHRFRSIRNQARENSDKNTTTSSVTSTCTAIRQSESPLVEKLRHLIWTAEYEAFQDPYRGIQFLEQEKKHAAPTPAATSRGGQEQEGIDDNDDNVTKTDNHIHRPITPWDACQCGILSDLVVAEKLSLALREPGPMQCEDRDGLLILDPKNPETLVRNLTEARCPSLTAWTRQKIDDDAKTRVAMDKKRKGKRRTRGESESAPLTACFGKRPSDPKYRCPCDYNPFCLASLGGVVHDIFKERCEKDISILNDDNCDNKRVKGNGLWRSLSIKAVEPSMGDSKVDTVTGHPNGRKSNVGTPITTVIMDSISGETDRFKYEKLRGGDKGTPSKSDSQERVLLCKRLNCSSTKPATGEPGHVYTQELKHQCLQEIKYSQSTQEEMAKLRKSRHMGRSKIMIFLRRMMQHSPPEKRNFKTATEYMDGIAEWHRSILFVPPTVEEGAVPEGQINVVLPPGIQNLGATCYLNTQLQCLAQNPVFLEGIFSWRAVNSSHNMNGVMTRLQNLLAKMVFGGDGTLSTLDFSNALGLEHYEQQDPNEFARLLFDRMEESFQQCSEGGSGGEIPGADLSHLLRRIFHGTTTYETTCMECGNVSARTEGFMDLNLPISPPVLKVDGDSEDENGCKKRAKSGTIQGGFAKQNMVRQADTTVQICLNQYLQAEFLDGDNQYFCEKCNRKQNAKRIPRMTGLPPVLNVQLSRYVFDREKFVKKKRTEKVLLPIVLTLNCNDNDKESKRYALCAVMKHQGTSAYSGHYVAEAMDWTTGVWYEFNDETVKVLPGGPSSSYDPFLDDADQSSDAHEISGSEDAYNMYYVSEEYLGQIGLQTIERRLTFARKSRNGEGVKSSVRADVLKERESKYSILGE
jgi:ubiquitin C-terminal hydrolase